MIALAQIKPQTKAVDLGSGDGRIVIALARAGVDAVGYEINPILAWWSRIRIYRLGLQSRARIYNQSFWSADLSGFDVVMIFGITHIMGRLEKKLKLI